MFLALKIPLIDGRVKAVKKLKSIGDTTHSMFLVAALAALSNNSPASRTTAASSRGFHNHQKQLQMSLYLSMRLPEEALMSKRIELFLKFTLVFIWSFAGSPILNAQTNSDVLGALRYRYIGPVGNRVTSVVSIPGQPNIYYVGAASGGIFKTTDGGVRWESIFDDQPVSSIGSLAIAPSDPNIIWAGTGEAWIRSHISVGQGIYKSTDAGKTWSLMGLEKTGRIGRIVIEI